MKLSLPLGVSLLSFLCVYLGSAQKIDGLKGEVELITEPRPGNEFVQIHTTDGEKTPTRFLKQAGKGKGIKEKGTIGKGRERVEEFFIIISIIII